jgi:toluene monooxygenase system ferredoxin subunit
LFDGATLTCHMHLWQWDIRSGAPLGIAEAPLQRYPLAREGDALYLGGESTALDVGELFNGLNSPVEKLATLGSGSHPRARCIAPATRRRISSCSSGRIEFLIGRAPRGARRLHAEEGEVFGWAALLEGTPARIASARCLEDSSVLRINGKAALGVLEGDPAAGFTVMRRLAALIARYLASSGAR